MRRAFLVVACAAVGPVAIGWLAVTLGVWLGWDDVPDRAFEATVWWTWLAMSYLAADPPPTPPSLGYALTAMQWIAVASVVGVFTRRMTNVQTAGIATAAVVAVGTAVLWALAVLGFSPAFEGP